MEIIKISLLIKIKMSLETFEHHAINDEFLGRIHKSVQKRNKSLFF